MAQSPSEYDYLQSSLKNFKPPPSAVGVDGPLDSFTVNQFCTLLSIIQTVTYTPFNQTIPIYKNST